MLETVIMERGPRRSEAKIAIGLNDEQRSASAAILNTVLSDETLLYVKTRACHWNVTGSHFNHLHQFFRQQYGQLEQLIDQVAERVRSLGAMAMGTLKEYASASRLDDYHMPDQAAAIVDSLLEAHEQMIRHLRADLRQAEELGDMCTSDFLTGLMQHHEKMAWMLRATAAR